MQTGVRITKTGLAIVVFIIVILIMLLIVDVKANPPYANCSEIFKATGRHDIPKGDKLYNPIMDKNKNNVACEGL